MTDAANPADGSTTPFTVSDFHLREPQTAPEVQLARAMMNIVPYAMFAKDAKGRFIAANRSLAKLFGTASWGEIVGKTDFDFHPHDEALGYQEIDRHVLETGESVFDLDETQTRRDGSVEVVRTTKLPIRDSAGKVVGLMGFSTDITEPRRVSDALAVSELRHVLAARASLDGIWDYHIGSGELFLSARCAELFRVSGPTERVDWERASRHMAPGDAKVLSKEMAKVLQYPSRSLRQEIAINQADGSKRWLSVVATAHIVDGAVVRLIGSAADTTEDHLRDERLKNEARHDDLTGLPNRRALIEAMGKAPGALIYLDLDSFKVVNDSLGHQAGDTMLVAVADRLRTALDMPAVLCRFGGDEFAVLLETDRPDAAEQAATRLQDAITSPFAVSGLEIYTTASIGIVSGAGAHGSAVEVLRDADIALYEAKGRGKAQAVHFTPDMRQRAEERLDLQMRLRRAVDEMEFVLHYQPILNAADGSVEGVEALLRWAQPDGAVELPAAFLPYLEESGLIVPVGEWVVEEGCRQLAAWKLDGPELQNIRLNVNVSRAQLGSPQLVSVVESAIARHGIDPAQLIVEITETAIAQQSVVIRTQLAALRSLGVMVAIDDFGVGESSLSVLHDLPVDILKLDRSFTSRIIAGEDEPVTSAVLQLAAAMNLVTVAEGIEFEHQATWLTERNCHCIQGNLISRPLPGPDFPAFLIDRQAPSN